MKLFRKREAWRVVENIRAQGVVCVPECLSTAERKGLLAELKDCRLTRAPELLGDYNVRQNFHAFREFPPHSRFVAVRNEIEPRLNELFSSVEERRGVKVCSKPLRFNDMVVQVYEPSREGISPHRDGKSRINIVALLILEGKGSFFVCDDRAGNNPRPVRNRPGDLLLMRGPGFLGEEVQPFHCVTRIETRRATFGLRHQEVRR